MSMKRRTRATSSARTRESAVSSKVEALEELLHRVPLLYHRLRALTQAVHGEGETSGARRSLLRTLAAGPATVPKLARERAVARQVVQRLVDGLLADGLVALLDNPDHARSKLVGLTRAGETRLREIVER